MLYEEKISAYQQFILFISSMCSDWFTSLWISCYHRNDCWENTAGRLSVFWKGFCFCVLVIFFFSAYFFWTSSSLSFGLVLQLDLTFHLFVCALAGAGAAVIAMVSPFITQCPPISLSVSFFLSLSHFITPSLCSISLCVLLPISLLLILFVSLLLA